MRIRLLGATAVLAALAVALPSAQAATPVLDGKKVKKLTLSATSTAQSNDADLITGAPSIVTGRSVDRVDCKAPRCAVLNFVYKPAKGVKGDVLLTLTWGATTSDFDLFFATQERSGRTEVASCGGSAGTTEKVFVPAKMLKAGKTYALVADFYRTPGEKVTGTVQMPGANTVKGSFPEVPTFPTLNDSFNCTS